MTLFDKYPIVQKPDLFVPPSIPQKYQTIPSPNYDVVKYASDSNPTLPPYIVGSSAKVNTSGLNEGYKMSGVQAALCLREYGGFSGVDLIHMVGIWNRETIGGADGGCYPHQIVWRPSTKDYSFGGGGFNMINDLGPARRAALTKVIGFPIHNLDLLSPMVMAKACRWLFDIGLASDKHDGLYHWGAYKPGGTGLDGVNLKAAEAAVINSMVLISPKIEYNEFALYFQKAANFLTIPDDMGRPLVEDGLYGNKSRSVCVKIQAFNHMITDGRVTHGVWDVLDLAVLRKEYGG